MNLRHCELNKDVKQSVLKIHKLLNMSVSYNNIGFKTTIIKHMKVITYNTLLFKYVTLPCCVLLLGRLLLRSFESLLEECCCWVEYKYMR